MPLVHAAMQHTKKFSGQALLAEGSVEHVLSTLVAGPYISGSTGGIEQYRESTIMKLSIMKNYEEKHIIFL